MEGSKCLTIHEACKQGDLEGVRFHLKEGASVDLNDSEGYTPLYWAASEGHLAVVNHLLQYGADVNRFSVPETTPVCVATQNGHLEVVKLLVQNGARLDLHNNIGYTPLHVACQQQDSVEMVKFFLESSPKTLNDMWNCFTALFVASYAGCIENAKVLLEHGANPDGIKNSDVSSLDNDEDPPSAISPLYAAAFENHWKLVELLLDCGAKANVVDYSEGGENVIAALHLALLAKYVCFIKVACCVLLFACCVLCITRLIPHEVKSTLCGN